MSNPNQDILIWGAGAIGGTVGAYLARAGYDVTLVDADPAHVAAIRQDGLHITGPIDDMVVRPPAFTPAEVQGKWQRVFLAVKAHHTTEAARQLLPHLADDGYVLSLQNGLCEPLIVDVVGAQRVIGAFVNFYADWVAPGELLYSNRAAVVIGELDGRVTPRAEQLLQDLHHFEPDAILSDDVDGYLWGKLAYGAMLFAQAVGMSGIADVLERDDLFPLWRGLAQEVVDVAQAEQIDPRGFNGFEPAAFAAGAPEARARASIQAMVDFNRPNTKTHSGVWRDLAIRKRKTEVDMIAVVVTVGRQHGKPCPILSQLVAMIGEIEQGKRAQTDDNLLELVPA
ncbi:ketopantoate reductase family protein [Bordetella genomosp. 12]|uniref:2-dehydropantoate 2-reductase n=1 Tax=Bordetella genomosp. 12 TaxID=463035 RepID=A0A261VV71_9BORD|nr:2-dehydropantoate 2-reductase [Bordetella genomosp. 12]OZI77717.1 2-dehydropantoate 2-reductase [Bordetella genomosp. 12]